jgi:tetratricopeptide (TPR) repeat protein
VRLHRRIAELLDDRPGTPIEQLAHHYLEAAAAGMAPRAIEVACEAARDATTRMAWDDALRLHERALEVVDLLDDDDPGLRSEILSAMAHAHHGKGASEAARRCALSAAELARSADDAARLAQAGIAYQGPLGVWARPSDPVGVEIIREGLAELPADRPDVRAEALAVLAQALLLSPGGALTEADDAVAAAREVGDIEVLGGALVIRAWAVRGVLGAEGRLVAAEEALELAVARGDRFGEYAALYQLGNAHLTRGDLVGARATFARDAEFSGALDRWASTDFDASHALAQGRFAEAEARSEDAHRLGTALGDTNDFVQAYQRWALALATGDVAAARTWQQELATTVAGLVVPAAPLTALAAGDEAAARAGLASWVDEIEPLVPPLMLYVIVHHVSVLAFRLDTLSGLEHLVDYVERFPGELLGSDAGIAGAADAARGRFAAVQGDLDRAVTLLEAGHALHERLELHQLSVESAIDLARVLLRRDRPGDHESAQQLLGQAGSLAEQLGMAPAHAEARALLA